MAPLAETISKKSGTPDLDYEALRAEALRLVQKLSGKVWTDFNIHDPGVTLLEEIIFAITELGYKTGFDIEDYLTSKNNLLDLQREALYSAEQVCRSCPVTLRDYSELFTREIDGAASVKFESCDKGIYSVRIYPVKVAEFEMPRIKKKLLDSFAEKWNEWRNLGENVVNVAIDWAQSLECQKPLLLSMDSAAKENAHVKPHQRRDFLGFSPIVEQFPACYRDSENAAALQNFLLPIESLFKKFLLKIDDFSNEFSIGNIGTDYQKCNRILNQMLAVYGVVFPDELFRKIHGGLEQTVCRDLLSSKTRYLQFLPELQLHRCGKHFKTRIELMLGVKTQIFDGIFFENGFGKVYVVWEHPERFSKDVQIEMEKFVRDEVPAHLIPKFYWVPSSINDRCSRTWFNENEKYMSESLWI